MSSALVMAAQRGDTMAMNDLLAELTPYLGRVCGPIALDSGPDAVQEALIAVFRHLRELREPEALHGWARAIAVREAVRIAKRDARSRPEELGELPSREDVERAVDVQDVLERLSPEHRAVLVLRDLEGVPEEDAARSLRVAPGTVKSRLHRARENFRRAWSS
ncbi:MULTISPECIES: RNA polymerase sigma factor [Streptosporangium]|uniref:RNA polymerase sigma-70 factor (ECF subfamily) n=1 Tax=Streptosporangium brasiliense TaxID=47480 RepID=A0ABT9RHS6_9ACTN|nr:sigma-70 family RNA polymerase sigma factor [Streptosporangium brasiliense]MDP9868839.1 RNA polymerase sigma-70 factor (ECF subfamily) [Streptosporangium brasiliense]